MTTAFVLGNGISRQAINLEQLKTHGAIYGCNALYRDFVPDVLVATDMPIATQIQQSGYAKQHRFYTRKPLENLGALKVSKPYYGYSSGPIAASLAAADGHVHIYLLGFDMGPTESQKFNNLYAGTEFYKAPDAPPTFTGNWVKQILHVTKDYNDRYFFRICGKTTAEIPELLTVPNLVHQDLDQFLDRINNKKDL
jgi:hypothetical protein